MAFLPANLLALNIALCEALGLDPSMTLDINIAVPAQGVITVTFEQYVDARQMETITKVFRAVTWTPVDD